MPKAAALPSIKQLITESWETTKDSWWGVVKVWIITFAAQAGLFLIGLIAVLAMGAQSKVLTVFSQEDPTAVMNFLQTFGVPMAVVFVAWLVATMVVSIAGQIASLRMVYQAAEHPSARDLFKGSFKYVLPMLGMGLIAMLIIMGGFFALVIPGIIFSFLFAFSTMELVFNHQSVLGALKRSVSLVWSHFGDVFLRWVVLIVISLLVSLVFAILGDSNNDGVRGIVSLLSMIVNWAMMFFSFAYGVTLYRHVAKAGVTKNLSWMWPLITSVIGWVIGAFILMSVINWARSDEAQNLFKSWESQGSREEEMLFDDLDDSDLEKDFMNIEKELDQTTGSAPSVKSY